MVGKTAIIGLGEMGSILAERLLAHGLLPAEELRIYDRHPEKMAGIKEKCSGVYTAQSAEDAVDDVRYIFLCIQPVYVPNMICRIKGLMRADANLFISTSNVNLEELSKIYSGKATKFLPTVNSAVDRGVIFAAHNKSTPVEDREFFGCCMKCLCGQYYEIEEPDFALLNNLAGCAPAFLAYFCTCMYQAAFKLQSRFSCVELEGIFRETFIATGMRMMEEQMDFASVITGVGKPGGITDTALSALRESLPQATEKLMHRSIKRHKEADRAVSDEICHCCTNR